RLGFRTFAKKVSASAFDGDPNQLGWVGVRTVAMGSKAAVSIMQRVIRALVFERTNVRSDTELRPDRPTPQGDVSVACLDGFDFARQARTRLGNLDEPESAEHSAFVHTCQSYGIPLNAGKAMVSALRAGILGGLFMGGLGLLSVAPGKAQRLAFKGATLVAQQSWTAGALRHWAGQACFAAGFRRPLFAVLEQIFPCIQGAVARPTWPDPTVAHEIPSFTMLLPLAHSNHRAPVKRSISCADASEHGGGAAEAVKFRRQLGREAGQRFETHFAQLAESQQGECAPQRRCAACGAARARELAEYPEQCGASMCSVPCVPTHCRRICQASHAGRPAFFERRPAPACLTWDVARANIGVRHPLERPRDFSEPQVQRHVHTEADHYDTQWEHWEMPLDTFVCVCPGDLGTRCACGANARTKESPYGGRGVGQAAQRRVALANRMASLAFRCLLSRVRNGSYAVVANPWHSWLWHFQAALDLQECSAIFCTRVAALSGDARGVATIWRLLHNSARLHAAFAGARVRGPWSADDYRRACVEALAVTFADVGASGVPRAPSDRPGWVLAQLGQSRRNGNAERPTVATGEIMRLLGGMLPGQEHHHLRAMVARADARGSHVCLATGKIAQQAQSAPRPAFAKQWETAQENPWKSMFELDDELSEYTNHMWLNGDSHGYAADAVSAVARFCPGARAAIPTTRQCLRNWDTVLVLKRAFPVFKELARAMVGAALAYDRADLAALVLAGFLGLLRLAEIESVTPSQIHTNPDERTAIIVLPDTKGAKKAGGVEHVIIQDTATVEALRSASAG
ncbi:unnamed protein product, partial [Prorocentrum cordatum]